MIHPATARQHNASQVLALLVLFVAIPQAQAQVPRELRPWLESPQAWQRNTDRPVLFLGKKGQFGDEHIFAPMVALENGKFTLWHCDLTLVAPRKTNPHGLSVSWRTTNATSRLASSMWC